MKLKYLDGETGKLLIQFINYKKYFIISIGFKVHSHNYYLVQLDALNFTKMTYRAYNFLYTSLHISDLTHPPTNNLS